MSQPASLLWAVTPAVALVVAALTAPLAIGLARRAGALAHPGGRHVHEEATPLWGGLAIYAGVICALAVAYVGWGGALGREISIRQLLGILLGATLIAGVGAVDDRFDLRPSRKLLGQILCAALLLPFGLRIEGLFGIPLPGWLGSVLAVLWIVAVVNTINFIDGLDGLAAGVSLIASTTFALMAISQGKPAVAVLALATAGGAAGFLPYNFNPARVFMGDLGSHLLGYLLSVTAMVGVAKIAASVTIFSAMVVLAVPILDTAFAVVRRLRRGQPISVGDKEHLHHRLLDAGLSQRQAVILIYGISGAFCALAMWLMGGR